MTWVNTSPLVKTYSLEEFWELPASPDGSKLEIIGGVLYMTPPPEGVHDRIVARLNRIISNYLILGQDAGTLYVPRAAIWTGPATYLEPDLFYVSEELESTLDPSHRDTADLVIEVVSPGSSIYDRNTKADTYAALGVRQLWLVSESDVVIEVRTNSGSGFDDRTVFSNKENIRSGVFPELELSVDEVFDARV